MWDSALGGRPPAVRGWSDGQFGDLPGPGHKGQAIITACVYVCVCDSSLKCHTYSLERETAPYYVWLSREKRCLYMAHDSSSLDLMSQVSPNWQSPGNSCGIHSWSTQGLSYLLFQRAVHRHAYPSSRHFSFLHTMGKKKSQHEEPSSTLTYYQDGPKLHLPKALWRLSMIFFPELLGF